MKPILPQVSDHNKKILHQLFISYSLMILVLLIIGLYFYMNALDKTEQQLKLQNQYTLDTKIADMDSSFYTFNQLASQISLNSDIRKLMHETEITAKFYLESVSAMKYLSDLFYTHTTLPIENCFIYLPDMDYVILPTNSMDAYSYYYHRKKYDQSSYQDFITLLTDGTKTNSLLSLEPFLASNSEPDSYLYVCNLYSGSAVSKPRAYLCFTIDDQKLMRDFPSETAALYIINEKQEYNYLFSPVDTLTYHPEQLVAAYERRPSSTVYEYQDEEYIITKSVSTYNTWTYYYIQPSSYLLEDFHTYKQVHQLLIFLASVFSLIGLFLVVRRNMKPYIEMESRLTTSETEKETLHNELINQRPYVCNAYLSRIMNGTTDSIKNLDEVMDFLGLDFTKNHYAVLYIIKVPSYDRVADVLNHSIPEELTSNNPDSTSQDELIENELHQMWGEETCIYRPEPNHYAILIPLPSVQTTTLTINPTKYEDYVELIHTKFTTIQAGLEKNYGVLIGAGFGKANARINYVWESYHLAKEAVAFISKNHTFQCYKYIIRNNHVYYYPVQLVEQLILFITSGNSRQTAEIFKIIRNENFELRSLPLHIQDWLVSDLRNTLVKIRYEMVSTDQNRLALQRLDEMMLSIKTVGDAEKAAFFMASLQEPSVEKNKLITNIEQYIIENYADSELSLKKISDVFEISESYFSSLFKSETKQNFSEYLENIRMGHAMALLKNANISISNIYEMVGYNNPNSFRRAFKKTYGVSPSNIRSS